MAGLLVAAAAFAAAAVLTLTRPGAADPPPPAPSWSFPLPALVPSSASLSPTPAAAAPSTTSPSASARPQAEGKPAPFIQTFAADVRAQPRLPSPRSTRSMPVHLDGCDHAYGTRTQCVPWAFPPGVTDKCAWLAAHGYLHLAVVGPDRQHLDPDRNAVACDS